MTGGSVGFVGFDPSAWGGTAGSSGSGFVGREVSAEAGVSGCVGVDEAPGFFGGLVCSGRLSGGAWVLAGADDPALDFSCSAGREGTAKPFPEAAGSVCSIRSAGTLLF